MSEFEIFIPLPDSEWNDGVLFQKYNDDYSVVSAGMGQNTGKPYMRWCFPQTKERKASEKSIPIKIRLGKRHHAIQILVKMLTSLGVQVQYADPMQAQQEEIPAPTPTPPASQQATPEQAKIGEDIPF